MSGTEAYQNLYKRVRRAHRRHHTLAVLNAFVQALFYAMLAAGLAWEWASKVRCTTPG